MQTLAPESERSQEQDRLGWWMVETERLVRSLLEVLPYAEAHYGHKQRKYRASSTTGEVAELKAIKRSIDQAHAVIAGKR